MDDVKYLIRKAPKLDDSGETQNIAKHGVGIQEIIDRLAEYEEAEKQGRLVILPCNIKIGDKVFRVVSKCLGAIQCPFEGGYGLDRCYNCDTFIKEESFSFSMFEDIGKTVFLTREEAEAAMNGGQDK